MSTQKSKLTPKQLKFVLEYLIDLNATQAAIRAGYSKKTAYSVGWENLRKPEIADAIEEGLKTVNRRVFVDAVYVAQGLKDGVELYKGTHPNASVKCLELLGKREGMFEDHVKHSGEINNPAGFNVIANGTKRTVGNRVQSDAEADAGDGAAD